MAENWDGLADLLTDLAFVESKCAAGMTYDLISDYVQARELFPEAAEENAAELRRKTALAEFAATLVGAAESLSGGTLRMGLDPAPPDPFGSAENRRDRAGLDAESCRGGPLNRLERLRAYEQFINAESSGLSILGARPFFCTQQAYNWAMNGPVGEAAARRIKQRGPGHPLLLKRDATRPLFNPNPLLLQSSAIYATRPRVVVAVDGRTALSILGKNRLVVWHVETGQWVHDLEAHTDKIIAIAMTPDGKWGASWGFDLLKNEASAVFELYYLQHLKKKEVPDIGKPREFVLRVWDLSSGQCVQAVRDPVNFEYRVERGSLALTADGSLAITISEYGKERDRMRIWNAATGSLIQSLPAPSLDILESSPLLGSVLVVKNDKVQVFDLRKCQVTRELNIPSPGLMAFCSSPEGLYAATGDPRGILRVWDVKNGSCVREIYGHEDAVSAVSLSAYASRLASADLRGVVRVWDTRNGKLRHELRGHAFPVSSLTLTADGRRAVTASNESTRTWDIDRGQVGDVRGSSSGEVKSLALGHQKTRAVSFHQESWPDGGTAVLVWDAWSAKKTYQVQGPRKYFGKGAVNPNGVEVIFGRDEGGLEVIDAQTGGFIRRIDGPAVVKSAALAPDGKHVITGNRDGSLAIWDLDGATCLKILKGHVKEVDRLFISRDGRIAVSSTALAMSIWDLEHGECRHVIQPSSQEISGLALSPDGEMVYVAGAGVSAWKVRTGRKVRDYDFRAQELALSSDGRRVIVSLADWLIVRNIEDGSVVAQTVMPGFISSLQTQDDIVAVGDRTGGVYFLEMRNLEISSLPAVSVLSRYELGPGLETERPKGVVRRKLRIGKTAPCPCGSGKIYKSCCGREVEP